MLATLCSSAPLRSCLVISNGPAHVGFSDSPCLPLLLPDACRKARGRRTRSARSSWTASSRFAFLLLCFPCWLHHPCFHGRACTESLLSWSFPLPPVPRLSSDGSLVRPRALLFGLRCPSVDCAGRVPARSIRSVWCHSQDFSLKQTPAEFYQSFFGRPLAAAAIPVRLPCLALLVV
jgi:hypothetical protein